MSVDNEPSQIIEDAQEVDAKSVTTDDFVVIDRDVPLNDDPIDVPPQPKTTRVILADESEEDEDDYEDKMSEGGDDGFLAEYPDDTEVSTS